MIAAEAYYVTCKVLDAVFVNYLLWTTIGRNWTRVTDDLVSVVEAVRFASYSLVFMILIVQTNKIKTMEARLSTKAREILDAFDSQGSLELTKKANRWQSKFWILNVSTYTLTTIWTAVFNPYLYNSNGYLIICVIDFFTYYRIVVVPDIFSKSFAKFLQLSLAELNTRLADRPNFVQCKQLKKLRHMIYAASVEFNQLCMRSVFSSLMWHWCVVSIYLHLCVRGDSSMVAKLGDTFYGLCRVSWIFVSCDLGYQLLQEVQYTQ